MKKLLFLTLIFSINVSCFYFGNDDDDITDPIHSAYEAVTISRESLENSTELIGVQPSKESGKIYVKDHYLIINEPYKGFHIYDNSNPESPIKIGFLKILGSTDISIKGNVIYANNAIDLIAITINPAFNEIEVTKRVKNIFPKLVSPDGFYHNSESKEEEIVLDWNLKTN
ncbi:LVIVD repeat-containing protein [Flavivirga eckloniae]|uniref:Uncharacterized protein n=1 Tax=Flavivirga eckloniae TaxID=1803846 RepID=A0A2K9PKJ1_9FLAO|nr:hypothetical protein [Flavivirga eckloniae]AUP77570.1 hypothetical protein C1H87_02075 [Flavivirga eckloniae]